MTTLIPKYDLKNGGSTPAGAINRPFNEKLNEIVSVKDFGAIGNGTTDDTDAIQKCIDYVAGLSNGGLVYIPAGNYKITSVLTVPGSVGIKGDGGNMSLIQANGCNAITFSPSLAIATIPIEDFGIVGTGTSTYIGLSVLGTTLTSDKVYGLRINRLTISNFATACSFRSLWNSSIENCYLFHNINGIKVLGQTVKLDIIGNYSHYSDVGTSTLGIGVTISQTSDYSDGTHRPEDIQIHRNLIFNFDTGVQANNGLFIAIDNNDIDATTNIGIDVSGLGGLLNINENWIGLTGTGATCGIKLEATGSDAFITKLINGNEINSISLGSDSGIKCSPNQNNCAITNNDITNFATDIWVQTNGDVLVSNNFCKTTGQTSLYLISTLAGKTITVENNNFASLIYCHPSNNLAQIVFGQNDGLNSTYIRGKSTILSGQTTVTTTYASLTTVPPNFATISSSYVYPELFIGAPAVNIGSVYGTASITGVTINCTTAPGADTVIHWEVKGFQGNLN